MNQPSRLHCSMFFSLSACVIDDIRWPFVIWLISLLFSITISLRGTRTKARDGRTFVAPKMKHLQAKVRLDSESSRKSCTLTEGCKRRGEREWSEERARF